MDEESSGKCFKPKNKNNWERKKTFFEVAAAQSSLKNVNPNLPDSLVSPLISVLDPCTVHSAIHTKVDWSLVKTRLVRGHILARRPPPTRLEVPPTELEGSSDGGTSRCSSPAYSGKSAMDNRGLGEPMDTSSSELSEEAILRREKDYFIDEMVDLVRNIKKHNDPALSSSPTWIDRLQIEKISKQLVMLQNYQPSLITVEEIIHGLLFENGIEIIENLIIEMPEHLVLIVNCLLNQQAGIKNKYRNMVIGNILEVYPCFAKRIVYKLADRRSDCAFACRVAVDHLSEKEFLEFLEPMLSVKDSTVQKIVVKASNRTILPIIVTRLLNMAEAVLNPVSSEPSEMGDAPWCTLLSYCLVELMSSAVEPWKEREVVTVTRFVFRTSNRPVSLRAGPSESESVDEPMDTSFQDNLPSSQDSIVPDSDPETSQAISRPPPLRPGDIVEASPFGEEHECFLLAALIAVPVFTQYPQNQTGAVQPPDPAVEKWLKEARKRVLIGEKVTSTFGAHLIFVHSCIMTNRVEELSEFVSRGMKQTIELAQRPNHVQVLKNALMRCMTDIEVAKRSVCLQSTKGSPNNSIALRTVHALQSTGVYKAFQITIKPWLELQLDCISLPVSKLLADIVDGFAQSSGNTKGKGLSKEFIEDTFNREIFDSRTVPKRLFVLLYMCSYRESCHRHDSSLKNMMYDLLIYRKMPVRYLLSIMDKERENFEEIRMKMIMRVSTIFPFSLPTPVSMRIVADCQELADMEIREEEHFKRRRKDKALNELKADKDLNKVLETIKRSGIRDQISAIPIVVNIFMSTLKESAAPGYESLLMAMYDRFEQIDPFAIFLQSATSWVRHDPGIDLEDIIKIPSLLFRCDRRIFSSPAHFHCFIRTLNFFNKWVRIENRLKTLEIQHKSNMSALANPNRVLYSSYCIELDRAEKELLTGAYLDIQQSALVHALIEVCDAKRMNDDPTDFDLVEKRKAIRNIAYEFIHRTFLDYEGLIKVVLYQRFPLSQVRDLVQGVPALFAGNSRILEMLSLADTDRRFFAIVFAAEICRKYRVRESLETARVVCDIVHSLHKFGELPSSHKVWKHVAPALIILAGEFPSLADSIHRLLLRVLTAARSRMAVRSGLFAGDPNHEEYGLIEKITSFLDRNRTQSSR